MPVPCCLSQPSCLCQQVLHLAAGNAAWVCPHRPAQSCSMPCRAYLTDSIACSSGVSVTHLCPVLLAGLAWPALCRLTGGHPPLRLRRALMGTAWRASASSYASSLPANCACGCRTRPGIASSRPLAGENCPTDWQWGLLLGVGASAQVCFHAQGGPSQVGRFCGLHKSQHLSWPAMQA